jgi:nucleoside phosphorylase
LADVKVKHALDNTGCLNFVVALSCEAKPLVDYYRLEKQSTSAFPYYFKPSCAQHPYNINLVVSGIGLQAMATACGWLGGVSKTKNTVWLNVGTAGHATLKLGEIARVVCAAQSDSEIRHFPPLVAKWGGVNASLISSAAPVSQYPEQLLVDMEASAFFMAAKRFASAELVQALKVISDNPDNKIELLNATKLSALIASQMDLIHEFSMALIKLAKVGPSADKSQYFAHELHCTVSQSLQFNDLTSKLHNLNVEKVQIDALLKQAPDMKTVLADLKALLSATAPDLAFSHQAKQNSIFDLNDI